MLCPGWIGTNGSIAPMDTDGTKCCSRQLPLYRSTCDIPPLSVLVITCPPERVVRLRGMCDVRTGRLDVADHAVSLRVRKTLLSRLALLRAPKREKRQKKRSSFAQPMHALACSSICNFGCWSDFDVSSARHLCVQFFQTGLGVSICKVLT